jgi:predicted metal-dependent phosphoesterase TrpH
MHSAHSDGSCVSQSGVRVPCPAFRTVEAAAASGLDFIALSDHNTVSHFNDLRELQPYFDRLLLIPATEITTFHGHVQAIGLDRFIDFRLGTPAVPDPAALANSAVRAGAILSINHPGAPSGEMCMGCGWTAPGTDYDRVQAVEAINGRTVEGPFSNMPFWYARLNEGHHLTGIGGSDSHDPDAPGDKPPVGHPTTVVHAANLSQTAILDGVRAGNVFIDTQGTRDRLLEVDAHAGVRHATMGGSIDLAGHSARSLTLDIHVTHADGGRIEIVHRGEVVASASSPVTAADAHTHVRLTSAQSCGWVSVNVRDAQGLLLLVGNPVHVRCGATPD